MRKNILPLLFVPFLLVSCAQKEVSQDVFLDEVSKIERYQYKEAIINCSGKDKKEKLTLHYLYDEDGEMWTSQDDTFGVFFFLLYQLNDENVKSLINSSIGSAYTYTFYTNPLAIESISSFAQAKITYNKFGYAEKYVYVSQSVDSKQTETTDLNATITYR